MTSTTFTHYSYMSCPVGMKREPTGLLNLSGDTEETRRAFIAAMLRNGELIASLPFDGITDMAQLRNALQWLHDNGRRR